MILRRLTKHVKDQNWFAVTLDFVIVVIGVLLAMQISNWNAARGDRERGAGYSAQLSSDLRAELATVDAITDYYATTFSAGRTAYVAGGVNSLDYSCELNADPESITAAVMALRADENLIRALRLRNVQLGER